MGVVVMSKRELKASFAFAKLPIGKSTVPL
jgi:hypothetical protein